MLTEEFKKRFLSETDETGRFIVISKRTGKKYYVEPIGSGRSAEWGDINPATKKLEKGYGDKYTGSVNKKDSLITEENGFHTIHELEIGESPMGYISLLDEKYPDIV